MSAPSWASTLVGCESDLTLRPWRGLSEEQRAAIRMDYGMTGDTLRVQVRRALKPYLLAHLRVESGLALPQHLELVEKDFI